MSKHPFRNYYDRCVSIVGLSDRIGELDPLSNDYDELRHKYFEIENSFYRQYLATHVLPPMIDKILVIKGDRYKFTWKMDNSYGRCDIYFEKERRC